MSALAAWVLVLAIISPHSGIQPDPLVFETQDKCEEARAAVIHKLTESNPHPDWAFEEESNGGVSECTKVMVKLMPRKV